ARTGGGANGATLGPDGALYVANNGGLSLGHDGRWTAPDAIPGRIQRVTLAGEGSDVAVRLPGAPPNPPNDLCFGPDRLLCYPDGFCFDASGRLYAAGSLGDVVVVFEPDGEVRDIVEMGAGSEPTNCCLGDGALYVTLAGTGQLVALDMPVEPLPLYPARR